MSFCLHRVDTPFCGDGVVQDGEVRFFGFFLVFREFFLRIYVFNIRFTVIIDCFWDQNSNENPKDFLMNSGHNSSQLRLLQK